MATGCRSSRDHLPVQGQINRLKLIKRTMYGRAGFALLHAACSMPLDAECLHPASPLPVPDDTAHIARLAFPRGNLVLSLRDRLGPVFDDRRFAHLFPAKGQPAEAPWRLALVTLLQFAEGLSDRQAADAVRSRIDWKY